MTSGEIDVIVQKDIEEKEKNEFEQPKQINVRSIIKEEDIKKIKEMKQSSNDRISTL